MFSDLCERQNRNLNLCDMHLYPVLHLDIRLLEVG